jgi:hypothetical protein
VPLGIDIAVIYSNREMKTKYIHPRIILFRRFFSFLQRLRNN